MHLRKIALVILFVSMTKHAEAQTATQFPGTVSSVKDINTQKLLQIMNQGSLTFTPVAAHRGYWQHVPENSLDSIGLAYDSNIEALEIDVRIASTQQTPFQVGPIYGKLSDSNADLVLSHDECVDRQTIGSGTLRANPTSKCTNTSGFTASAYTSQQLRDRAGNPYTNPTGTVSYAPTFKDALVLLSKYLSVDASGTLHGPVLVVDLKDKDNASGEFIAWNEYIYGLEIMKKNLDESMWPAVIWKLKLTSALPSAGVVSSEISTHPGYGHLVLTIVPEDVNNDQYGPIGAGYTALLDESRMSPPYITQFEYVPFNARDGSDQYLYDGDNEPLNSFATYYQPSYYPEGVSNRFAGCCYLAPLNQAENGSNPISSIDTRGILDFATYYNVTAKGKRATATITSDNLLETMNYLVVKGYRDISQIK